jgi:type III secretion system YscI/HrpB-like protein
MVIAALSSALPASVAATPLSVPLPAPSRAPSDLAAERFKAMMGAPQNAGVPVVDGAGGLAPGPSAIAAARADGAAPVLGERILHSLGNRVSAVSKNWHTLAAQTRTMSGSGNPADFMRAQMDLLNLSVNAELVSKVGGRLVQNIDVLVKNP